MRITEKARVFATAAHAAVGQFRKYTGEAYIHHPAMVADIVANVGGTDEMIAAAFLHDVLEDTKVTVDVLRTEFGDEVANLVLWLTKVGEEHHGNRAARKALDCEYLAMAPAEVHTIKLADLIANTPSIVEHDPKFAKVYVPEKLALLEVLTKGNGDLRNRAYELCWEAL